MACLPAPQQVTVDDDTHSMYIPLDPEIPLPETPFHVGAKMYRMWAHWGAEFERVWSHRCAWFVQSDSDTWVNVPVLERRLAVLDPDEEYYA
eukprot:3332034-Pyramimonas_sp.AAC.1